MSTRWNNKHYTTIKKMNRIRLRHNGMESGQGPRTSHWAGARVSSASVFAESLGIFLRPSRFSIEGCYPAVSAVVTVDQINSQLGALRIRDISPVILLFKCPRTGCPCHPSANLSISIATEAFHRKNIYHCISQGTLRQRSQRYSRTILTVFDSDWHILCKYQKLNK